MHGMASAQNAEGKSKNVGYNCINPTPCAWILHPILHPKLSVNTGHLVPWCRKCRRFSKTFFWRIERCLFQKTVLIAVNPHPQTTNMFMCAVFLCGKINDNGAWGPKRCRTTEGAAPHWYCPLRLITSLYITIYSNFSSSNSPCRPWASVIVRVII